MAIVYTDTIEPRKPTQDITLGTTGETITLPGNDLRVNTVKDKGGNTLGLLMVQAIFLVLMQD